MSNEISSTRTELPAGTETVPETPDIPDSLPGFDARYYAARYRESAETGALAHFWTVGRQNGNAPTSRHDGPAWRTLAPALAPEDVADAVAFWPEGLDLAALRQSGLFDPAAYARASGLDRSDDRLLVHYLTRGWREGLDPSEGFSTSYYLETYPDVARAGVHVHPLVHYLRRGAREGRRPAPAAADRAALAYLRDKTGGWRRAERLLALFDADFYREDNPDVARAGVDPLRHFMERGWREKRDPSPTFSMAFYIPRNPELAMTGENPLVHFVVQSERRRGRTHPGAPIYDLREAALRESFVPAHDFYARVRKAFDADYYASNNRDVVSAGVDAFDHYMVFGWREGRDPTPDFSTRFYLDANPALMRQEMNPFVHYVLFGKAAGRPGTPPGGKGGKGGPGPVASPAAGESGGTAARAQSPARREPPPPPPAEAAALAAVPAAHAELLAPHMDAGFYRARYPEAAGADPARHYLAEGWRRGHDPSPHFSTTYYRNRYPDVAAADIPPFLHYVRSGGEEKREAQNYVDAVAPHYRPLVSVIVPSYNHARFLPQRMSSILRQGYDNLEIILLDDASTDGSVAILQAIAATADVPVALHVNETNSGNVFAQWRNGIERARGELILVCESDDFCAPDLLERLVPHFADRSVSLAFGRIQLTEADGSHRHGLDRYREEAEPGIWDAPTKRPAAEWFAGALGVSNVIANVGGCLFRNVRLPDAVWQAASAMHVCGDLFLYLHLAGAGQIVYEPAALAYFRQHEANTSMRSFQTVAFYEENIRVFLEIARHWTVPQATRERFLARLEAQHARHVGTGDFAATFDTGRVLAARRTVPHAQILIFAFTPGGGEFFPLNLANALARRGVKVSMMVLSTRTINEDMFARVDPAVSVYQAYDVITAGRAAYLDRAGISVLHSHMVRCEWFLTELDPDHPLERPLIVTLHGSYITLEDAPEATVAAILANVSAFVYTAERNLEFFHARGLPTDGFRKMANAMPADPRPAPFTRAELGIGEDDVVFTLVARGIKRKGWRASVIAFRALREKHGFSNAHLLMIGEGEATDDARRRAEGLPGVHFLGYRSEINGIFRLSDVVLLPTRFDGESYPLVVVQALQEGRPVIATDLGEIGTMISEGGAPAGRLLPFRRDTDAFRASLEAAMLEMMDPAARAAATARAAELSTHFDMERVTDGYVALYEDLADVSTRTK